MTQKKHDETITDEVRQRHLMLYYQGLGRKLKLADGQLPHGADAEEVRAILAQCETDRQRFAQRKHRDWLVEIFCDSCVHYEPITHKNIDNYTASGHCPGIGAKWLEIPQLEDIMQCLRRATRRAVA